MLFHFCSIGFRFIRATARAGLTSNYAVNQRCGEPATSSQATTGATNIFLCDPPVMARWISFDIDRSLPGVNPNEAILQLAEVSVKVYTRECDPTTTPGERVSICIKTLHHFKKALRVDFTKSYKTSYISS